MSSKLEPTIWSSDSGQPITFFDRSQLTITWVSSIRKGCYKTEGACLCQPISWSMATILCNSVAAVTVAITVMHTHSQAVTLDMIAMKKWPHGFPFLSCMGNFYAYTWRLLRPAELCSKLYRYILLLWRVCFSGSLVWDRVNNSDSFHLEV